VSDSSLPPPSAEELEALVASLREEIERLRAEIQRIRRDIHERPPHWE